MKLSDAVIQKINVLKYIGQEKKFNVALEQDGIEIEVAVALFDPELGYKLQAVAVNLVDAKPSYRKLEKQVEYILSCAKDTDYIPRDIVQVERSEEYNRAILTTGPVTTGTKIRYSEFLFDSGISIVFQNIKYDKENGQRCSSIVVSRRTLQKVIDDMIAAIGV